MRVSVGLNQFKLTMGQLASGVSVITARGPDGRDWGMTASAVTSLSLEPPMLLICVGHAATMHQLLVSAEVFGINVLAEEQAGVARRFADRERHVWEPHAGERSPGGLPLVPGALAHIDIARNAVVQGGDHSIIMGTVVWAAAQDGRPLCYFRGTYAGLAR